MGLFDQFPYTNFHELNLMWILEALKEIKTTTEQFVAINSLKYADPIQWNITSQYEKNTIVIDPQTGTAYISVQPVPTGVLITNTDYWSVVFDLERFVTGANRNFTERVEAQTTLNATFPTNEGEWLIWEGTLFKALTNIIAGDQYVIDSNIQRITIEEIKNQIYDHFDTITGVLADLDTTDKTNLVAAINEVLNKLVTSTGDLADLNTTDKSNLVAAINEVLNKLVSTTGELADLTTQDKTNLVAAINEVLDKLVTTTGALADLDTTDKSNLVAAINENFNTISSLQTRFNNLKIVNVCDYGATGDGVTDDTAAIQAAIDSQDGDVIYFPAGKYHTTASIVCRDNTRYIGAGRNCCEFLNSFLTGTFTLANNVFFESLNFETDNNSGYAFYGADCFAVNINHVDCLGGYFRQTDSKFIYMYGNWHTLLMNDCIIDCGTVDDFAIKLISNGDNTVNKDVQMRDVFVDTWLATIGGSILLDSVLGVVLNKCIVRSKHYCLNMIRTIGAGICTCDSEFTFYDTDTSAQNVFVGGMCEFNDYGSSHSSKVVFYNDGVVRTYEPENGIVRRSYGLNAFMLLNPNGSFTTRYGNGDFGLIKAAPATTGAGPDFTVLSQGLPPAATWSVNCEIAIETIMHPFVRFGMILFDSVTQKSLFCGIVCNAAYQATIGMYLFDNFNTYNSDVFNEPYTMNSKTWFAISKTETDYVLLTSVDGVGFYKVGSIPIADLTFTPDSIGIAVDSETAATYNPSAILINVKDWFID